MTMAMFSLTRTTTPTSDAARLAALADPGFGRYYVDHMAVIDFQAGDGWQEPRIVPMTEWALHPAAAVLHYGQEIFEGLKAYRRDDDSIWLFRPERNAARFVQSAQRMGMAVLPEELFLDSVTELVKLERDWVPVGENEQSLYLRPFMIASEPTSASARPTATASPSSPPPPARTTRSRSSCGSRPTTRAPPPEAPAPPSAAATTPPAWWPRRRPTPTGAARCCGPTAPSTSGWRSAAR